MNVNSNSTVIELPWSFGSFEGYVLMNEKYKCPKCKEMTLEFEPNGMWD